MVAAQTQPPTAPCWAVKAPPQIAAWNRGRQEYRSVKLRRLRLTAQYFRDIIGGNFSMGQPVAINWCEEKNRRRRLKEPRRNKIYEN